MTYWNTEDMAVIFARTDCCALKRTSTRTLRRRYECMVCGEVVADPYKHKREATHEPLKWMGDGGEEHL